MCNTMLEVSAICSVADLPQAWVKQGKNSVPQPSRWPVESLQLSAYPSPATCAAACVLPSSSLTSLQVLLSCYPASQFQTGLLLSRNACIHTPPPYMHSCTTKLTVRLTVAAAFCMPYVHVQTRNSCAAHKTQNRNRPTLTSLPVSPLCCPASQFPGRSDAQQECWY